MIDLNDELLMEKVKRGDLPMLAPLVKKYEKPLFAFIIRVIRNQSEAEEIFQETFLRIQEKRATYKDGMPFRAWMYRISLNLCHDLFRSRSRKPVVSLDEEKCREALSDPKARMTRNLIAYRVRKAVSALPEKLRYVFLFAHYQGFSYQEISRTLDIPEGTVKSRMHEAVRRLAEELKDLEVES